MEENIVSCGESSDLMKTCHNSNTTDRRQCNNFSIDSILSTASSALAFAARHNAFQNGHENNNYNVIDQDMLHTEQKIRRSTSLEEDQKNDEEVTRHNQHREENGVEEEDVIDVGSEYSSPLQHNGASQLNINNSIQNVPVLGLSKGIRLRVQ